jgi:hypothetical protein
VDIARAIIIADIAVIGGTIATADGTVIIIVRGAGARSGACSLGQSGSAHDGKSTPNETLV